ncbi:COP9 signalosome complex subunit 3-like, partial [Olea europaea var. sylvestris]|uniref:COP9 signalosome complex subunit 3-like n=1 Tax=Olea europaea var. sylvestris TaxID=158386 RepID=UPI000C1D4148
NNPPLTVSETSTFEFSLLPSLINALLHKFIPVIAIYLKINENLFYFSWQFSSSFPKYTSSVAQRNLKNFSQPYLELVNSYCTGKISELEAFVQANNEKFESDKNLGLVKQVVSSMYKRNIQRLTQTYLTLSLEDIANTVQLNSAKEAEMHVLQMIQDGEIYATINQKDGMVRFLEDPEQYKTCEMIELIDSSIQRYVFQDFELFNSLGRENFYENLCELVGWVLEDFSEYL